MPLLLHSICSFLAYVAAVFVALADSFMACDSKLSGARGADARAGYSESASCRIESVTAKV